VSCAAALAKDHTKQINPAAPSVPDVSVQLELPQQPTAVLLLLLLLLLMPQLLHSSCCLQ
jgi:hypothetical protein